MIDNVEELSNNKNMENGSIVSTRKDNFILW